MGGTTTNVVTPQTPLDENEKAAFKELGAVMTQKAELLTQVSTREDAVTVLKDLGTAMDSILEKYIAEA